MSKKRSDKEYLQDIIPFMERILEYTAGMPYEEFIRDIKTQDAVLRNLQKIGESVKHITAELRLSHPEVPWREMARLRNRLIHHYFGFN